MPNNEAPADAGELVSEEGRGLRGYFTTVPNLILDDERVGPFEIALYLHYRRVAGDGGVCFQGRDRIAKATGIGRTRVLEARARLVELGYIRVNERGAPYPTEVTIADVWGENFARYAGPKVSRAVDAAAPIGRLAVDQTPPLVAPRSIDWSPRGPEEDPLLKKRDQGGPQSLTEELSERLEGVGMTPEGVDALFEILRAKGYGGPDVEWIVAQGVERRARSLAYYREIVATNPPGIVARLEAARRARTRQGPAVPLPRGAPHTGMPLVPPRPSGGVS